MITIVQLSAEVLADLARGEAPDSPVALSDYLLGKECRGTWARRAIQVLDHPDDLDWVTGVVWDEAAGVAVGRAGFHAAPDETGTVEVGYAIDPGLRRRGYATAALEVMLDRARRTPEVTRVLASVSPTNDASLAMVGRAGFVRIGEQIDDEDGLEWVFELRT